MVFICVEGLFRCLGFGFLGFDYLYFLFMFLFWFIVIFGLDFWFLFYLVRLC